MRQSQVRLLVVGAVVALAASGCVGESGDTSTSAGSRGAPTPADTPDEPQETTRAESPSEPQEVTIVAVDYAYTEAPTEVAAGVINLTFKNEGTVMHEVGLSGIGDTPLEQYMEDLDGGSGLGGDPFPEYLDQVAVPPFVGIDPGTTAGATLTLTEGRYAMRCSFTDVAKGDKSAPHYQLGMIRELIVTGGDAEPKLPEADGTITATDYAFDVDLEADDRTVNFVNEGPDEVHFADIYVYPKGTDAAEAEAAFKADYLTPGPAPEGLPKPMGVGFSGIFSDGLGATFELFRGGGKFESGRTYLVKCGIADRAGGEGHDIASNMYTVFTIE